MSDFTKVLAETKSQLKGMLTKDSTQEQIAVITELDKKLDSLNEAHTHQSQELETLKDKLIESVKATGFKVPNSQQDDSGVDRNQKSMDEILKEEMDKVIANRK